MVAVAKVQYGEESAQVVSEAFKSVGIGNEGIQVNVPKEQVLAN